MHREHPLRILRYSMKNLWLLIFPLLRGAYHFASRADVEAWLKGTWFELLILAAIFGYGWLNWFFREYTITDNQIYVRDGILFTRQRYLLVRTLSAMTIEHPFWLRPFRGAYLYVDTSSGLRDTPDIKLLIRQRDEKLFLSALPRLRQGKRHHFAHRMGLWRTLLFSVAFSSSFSGALYMAMFWFQGGRVARDLLEEFRVTERLNTVSEEVARKLMGIPPAAVAVGIAVISTWLLSFIANLVRYGGFDMESDKRLLGVNSGLVTRRHFYLVSRRINFIDLRQNLLTKLFHVFSLTVNCPGYGSQHGSIPICLPILTQHELEEAMPMIFPGSRLTKNQLKAPRSSWMGYVFWPVILAAAVIPALMIARQLFPQIGEAIVFFQIMLEIPIAWKLIVQITAFATTGMGISKGHICVRYGKGTTFHTIIADLDCLVKVQIHRRPWHLLSGKCHVTLYFRSESIKRCRLYGMMYDEVRQQLGTLSVSSA